MAPLQRSPWKIGWKITFSLCPNEYKHFHLLVNLTKVVNCHNAYKSCHLQLLHTKVVICNCCIQKLSVAVVACNSYRSFDEMLQFFYNFCQPFASTIILLEHYLLFLKMNSSFASLPINIDTFSKQIWRSIILTKCYLEKVLLCWSYVDHSIDIPNCCRKWKVLLCWWSSCESF